MTDAMPPVTEAQMLSVGDVHIDLRYRRVMRPDGHSELPQRMFDLLQVFLAEPGVLHTRDALFERVWPGVVVEDSNLSQSVWMLRKALGESRKHWIRTVSKRGYVFEPPGPVTVAAHTRRAGHVRSRRQRCLTSKPPRRPCVHHATDSNGTGSLPATRLARSRRTLQPCIDAGHARDVGHVGGGGDASRRVNTWGYPGPRRKPCAHHRGVAGRTRRCP